MFPVLGGGHLASGVFLVSPFLKTAKETVQAFLDRFCSLLHSCRLLGEALDPLAITPWVGLLLMSVMMESWCNCAVLYCCFVALLFVLIVK